MKSSRERECKISLETRIRVLGCMTLRPINGGDDGTKEKQRFMERNVYTRKTFKDLMKGPNVGNIIASTTADSKNETSTTTIAVANEDGNIYGTNNDNVLTQSLHHHRLFLRMGIWQTKTVGLGLEDENLAQLQLEDQNRAQLQLEVQKYGSTSYEFKIEGWEHNSHTKVLNAHKDIQLKALSLKNGLFHADAFMGTALLGLFVRYGYLDEAFLVFEDMPLKSLVTWNSRLSLLTCNEFVKDHKILFRELLWMGVSMSGGSFIFVLFELVDSEDIEFGEQIHGLMVKFGFGSEITAVNSLISVYVSLRNMVCGEVVHAAVIKSDFESDIIVGTVLVDFYAKCDKLISSHMCFDRIKEKNVISWNVLILGYSNIFSSTSILLLQEMVQLGYSPNEFLFLTILKSLSISNLHQLHGLVIKTWYGSYGYILSSLVMAYIRNGLINEALSFVKEFNNSIPVIPSNIIAGIYNRTCQYYETIKFLSLLEKYDVVSWNIVISVYARSNNNNEQCFLLADYGGLVSEDIGIFSQIGTDYRISPELDHYHCIVDLLAKNGQIKEAEKIIRCIPFPPNSNIWCSFLEACMRNEIAN
ncbi:hypothetical protein VNO77_37063 [Canavalia gladiata]|uniref:Pentatricopeptide repeat-containing protein n=1 Tax=Canavalia gladiata TaxID=3824 RepID=A0AAN9K7U7_CANGL